MVLVKGGIRCAGFKLVEQDEEGREIGRAFLFVMYNDLHERPFGLLEDVYVKEEHRGRGLASSLVQKVMELARNLNCYKLIAASRHERPEVHRLYLELGFHDHGKEFRFDL